MMSLWQPTIELNLQISVVLLGLNNEFPSDDSLVVDSDSLRATLDELFSSYLPPMMPPSSASRTERAGASDQLNRQHGSVTSPFRVRYDISYHVSHASRTVHNEYLEVLANAAEVDTTGEDGDYRPLLVPIDAISQAVEKLALHISGMAPSPIEDDFGDSEVTIFVANPGRAGLLARLRSRGKLKPNVDVDAGREGEYAFAEPDRLHRATQRTTEAKEGNNRTGDKDRKSSCARSWVGQGRVLVLDLGAAACGYGALGEDDPRSTVAESMFPSGSLHGDSGYWLHTSEQGRQGALGELVSCKAAGRPLEMLLVSDFKFANQCQVTKHLLMVQLGSLHPTEGIAYRPPMSPFSWGYYSAEHPRLCRAEIAPFCFLCGVGTFRRSWRDHSGP